MSDKDKSYAERLKDLARYVYRSSLAPVSHEDRAKAYEEERAKLEEPMSAKELSDRAERVESIGRAMEYVDAKARQIGAPVIRAEERLIRKFVPGSKVDEDRVLYGSGLLKPDRQATSFVRTDPETGKPVSAEIGGQRSPVSFKRDGESYEMDDSGRFVLSAGELDDEPDIELDEKGNVIREKR